MAARLSLPGHHRVEVELREHHVEPFEERPVLPSGPVGVNSLCDLEVEEVEPLHAVIVWQPGVDGAHRRDDVVHGGHIANQVSQHGADSTAASGLTSRSRARTATCGSWTCGSSVTPGTGAGREISWLLRSRPPAADREALKKRPKQQKRTHHHGNPFAFSGRAHSLTPRPECAPRPPARPEAAAVCELSCGAQP